MKRRSDAVPDEVRYGDFNYFDLQPEIRADPYVSTWSRKRAETLVSARAAKAEKKGTGVAAGTSAATYTNKFWMTLL